MIWDAAVSSESRGLLAHTVSLHHPGALADTSVCVPTKRLANFIFLE